MTRLKYIIKSLKLHFFKYNFCQTYKQKDINIAIYSLIKTLLIYYKTKKENQLDQLIKNFLAL